MKRVTITNRLDPTPIGASQVRVVSETMVGEVHADPPTETDREPNADSPKLVPDKVRVRSVAEPEGGIGDGDTAVKVGGR